MISRIIFFSNLEHTRALFLDLLETLKNGLINFKIKIKTKIWIKINTFSETNISRY